MADDQLAMFDDRPKERSGRRGGPTVDAELERLVTDFPHLEVPLRIVRQLCHARCPVITQRRVIEHAGCTALQADESFTIANEADWTYPYGPESVIPRRRAKAKKR